MSKLIKIDTEYQQWIKNLSERYRQSQLKAAVKVNTEMLRFYWSLGADIVNLKAETNGGMVSFNPSVRIYKKAYRVSKDSLSLILIILSGFIFFTHSQINYVPN